MSWACRLNSICQLQQLFFLKDLVQFFLLINNIQVAYMALNYHIQKTSFQHSLDENHQHLCLELLFQLLFVYQYVLAKVVEPKYQKLYHLYLTLGFCLKQFFPLRCQGILLLQILNQLHLQISLYFLHRSDLALNRQLILLLDQELY